eukprot:4420787-Lingulodinium_polyedra.AAC.1
MCIRDRACALGPGGHGGDVASRPRRELRSRPRPCPRRPRHWPCGRSGPPPPFRAARAQLGPRGRP